VGERRKKPCDHEQPDRVFDCLARRYNCSTGVLIADRLEGWDTGCDCACHEGGRAE